LTPIPFGSFLRITYLFVQITLSRFESPQDF
jgi:hypothetical protein